MESGGEQQDCLQVDTVDIHCRVDILQLHVSNISIRLQVVSSILSDLDTDIHRSRVPTCQLIQAETTTIDMG